MSTITFARSESQLFVTDMEHALAFFGEQLGFEPTFAHGEPPFDAQVRRGGAFLNLRLVPAMPMDRTLWRKESFLAASVVVEGIEALAAEYATNGVEFKVPLKREEWGSTTFTVADPEGNLILFAE